MSKITSDRKFVDDDLKLLAYTNIFFNNNELLDNLGTIGIQKGSEGHRVATQNAVRAVIDESTFEELVKQNRNDIGRAEESILNQYETGEYTDPLVKEVVDKFVKSYKDQHARHERAISDAQGLLVDEYRSGRMKNAAEKRLAERYDTQEERDKHYTDIIHELEEEFIKDKVGEKEYNRKLTDNNGVELDEKEYVSRKVKTMLQHKHLLAMKKAVADMKD